MRSGPRFAGSSPRVFRRRSVRAVLARRAQRRVGGLLLLGTVALLAASPAAAQSQQQPRVFAEPRQSLDYITHGPKHAPEQFADGMRELERRHGRFLRFSTIREETGQPLAVSVGPDGVPAWHEDDTGDGEDFYVVTVTDATVPDKDKEYALFTVAHAVEWCGREAIPRFFEDLATLAATAPDTVLDGASGLHGTPLSITVGQALRRTKLIFVDVAPDGWVAGESFGAPGPVGLRGYSQFNGAGVNGNRVAYQDGWVFPDDDVIRGNGYSTATQPEGIATTEYLRGLRDRELRGRPFATSMDFHGPLPVGALIFEDQGNSPAKLDRVHDLSERITQRAYGVLAAYGTAPGASIHRQFAGSAEDLRRAAFRVYQQVFGGVEEKALYLTLHWNEYATGWEHIDYTVSGGFGGWASSEAGLGADAFTHEIPCQVQGGAWEPNTVQLYVDNVRAMAQAMVVHAAFRRDRQVVRKHDLGGAIGYVETGLRVTDADGNPSPPPTGVRTPLNGVLRQRPYDVANTDYFRDLQAITPTAIVPVSPGTVAARSRDLSTLVVADHTQVDTKLLRHFAERGGNVVLTDSALRLLPGITGIPADSIRAHHSYVGYADLDRSHPMTTDLYDRARQMFDPVGLGYTLLMERDQYWPCTGGCEKSITQNSAPMWTVDREVWEGLGAQTVGTADPPADRKGAFEGTDTDKTVIGTMPLGRGRLVIYGGLLPQPTEQNSHWFGLNGYTISIPGQQLLLKGLRWNRTTSSAPGGAEMPEPTAARPTLPATGAAAPMPALLLLLSLATSTLAVRAARRRSVGAR